MVIGMLCGKLCHAACFGTLVWRTDWMMEVRAAKVRVGGEAAARAEQKELPAQASETPRGAEEVEAVDAAMEMAASKEAVAEAVSGGRTAKGALTTPSGHPKAAAKARRYAQLEEET